MTGEESKILFDKRVLKMGTALVYRAKEDSKFSNLRSSLHEINKPLGLSASFVSETD